jgi:hypothetical protein
MIHSPSYLSNGWQSRHLSLDLKLSFQSSQTFQNLMQLQKIEETTEEKKHSAKVGKEPIHFSQVETAKQS